MSNTCITNEVDTLIWLKSEIEISLDLAIKSLNKYKETFDDFEISFCQNCLHQINGSLTMVELYGASLVIEEMEKLLQSFRKNEVLNKEETLLVLEKTMTSLPGYLDSILSGNTDVPVDLLPLLNDMRVSRGDDLISENFIPSSNFTAHTSSIEVDENDTFKLLAKKLRHSYHVGLLYWFKNLDVNRGVKQVYRVTNRLQKLSTNSNVNKMLWITNGVMESIYNGGLESSITLKLLIGNVDREIQKFIHNNEDNSKNNIPEKLIKNLLYYVSCSSSNGKLIKNLKKEFNLHNLALDTEHSTKTKPYQATTNISLIQKVSSELIVELASLIDNLAFVSRSKDTGIEQLEPMPLTLSNMSDTLGFIGLGVQRATIIKQKQQIDSIIKINDYIDNNKIIIIAESLLSIKDSLTDIVKLTKNRFNTDTVVLESTDIDKTELSALITNKANTEMYKIKESLSIFSHDTANYAALSNVPHLLQKIQERLQILKLNRASNLIIQCNHFIQNDVIDLKKTLTLTALDFLADAISGIEYYIESLAGDWGKPETILDFVELSLSDYNEDKCKFTIIPLQQHSNSIATQL